MPEYVAWFGHNPSYFGQRFSELESLAQLFGVPRGQLFVGEKPSPLSTAPYAIIRLPNDEIAVKICHKAVLTKFIFELWGSGSNDSDVVADIKARISDSDWSAYFKDKTFSYKVLGYGMQHTDKSRRERMAAFGSLFRGWERVDLKSPALTLYIVDEHEHNFEQTGTRNELIQSAKKRTFYGRLAAVSDGESRAKYVLTERPVLGPTSLDNDLAFLMANVAEIDVGKFVFDPFCGTGGLLIAATATGGVPQVGTDIDIRVLKGEFVAYIRNQVRENMGTNIFENFTYYHLPIPEVVACDNSHPCWRSQQGLFDVILTDPPYGVRAGAKKIGAKYDHEIGNRESYFPQMLGYQPNEVNEDLLELASERLVDGGVLVFLLHIELMDLFSAEELAALPRESELSNRATKICVQKSTGKEYVYANECARDRQFLDEQNIVARVVPRHKDLTVESAVLQILAAGTGRVLVKMRRHVR